MYIIQLIPRKTEHVLEQLDIHTAKYQVYVYALSCIRACGSEAKIGRKEENLKKDNINKIIVMGIRLKKKKTRGNNN